MLFNEENVPSLTTSPSSPLYSLPSYYCIHYRVGHAGMQGSESLESHFNVRVIASCFDGMSLVLRHKMVYTLLASEMANGIHALSIYAKTPTEEANK